MDKKIKTKSKILKIIIMLLVSIMTIFIMNNKIFASGYWQGNENGGMPSGIYMPQILNKGRTFTGNPDTRFPYNSWTIDLDKKEIEGTTGMIYCSKWNTIVRNGRFDHNIYYTEKNDPSVQLERVRRDLKIALKQAARNRENNDNDGFGYDESYNPELVGDIGIKQFWATNDPIDLSQPFTVFTGSKDLIDRIKDQYLIGPAKNHAKFIFDQLSKDEMPEDIPGSDVNAGANQLPGHTGAWDDKGPDSYIYGPKVCITQPYGAGDPDDRGYEKVGSGTAENNQLSYILTAMENCYNSNAHSKYTNREIQEAHWLSQDNPNYTFGGNGTLLYNKALEYEEFVSEVKGGYKADIDIKEAQVIANQKTGEYTIGPLTMSYPEYADISYVKAIRIEANNKKMLLCDENTNDFKILCSTGVAGANGLTKTFPKSGEIFYIKFPAGKIGDSKSIKIYADFEYLSHSIINYNELRAEANIYQYMGHLDTSDSPNSPYALRQAYAAGTLKYKAKKTIPAVLDEEGNIIEEEKIKYDDRYISTSNEEAEKVYIIQPYIKMDSTPIASTESQPVRAALEGSRTYEVYHTGEKPSIDLSIELGGRVWVDNRNGKESKYDGIFQQSTDTPMSNVKVSLYEKQGLDGNGTGKFVAAMTTDEKGEYLFRNIDAMKQYYVKFTYNGQYYQPTIYNADRKSKNWKINSKGLDVLKERDAFNLKFVEVGSSPNNTIGCKVPSKIQTREKLEKAGLIDKFGNIPEKLNEKGERKSADNYVNDSMMDSYTCNGTTIKDLYPGIEIFVKDRTLNNYSNTYDVLKFVGTNKIEILYGNPDLMHHVNQGYVLRELVDLAMRKDVYKTTLEINGKTETYKYNKREHLETDENGNSYWEIPTRISDGYYNYEYSRELYREDYDYKKDNYKMEGPNTTLENLGLTEDSELKIFVTYKFTIRNRSDHIAAKVTEVVDYYDEDFTFVPGDSSLFNRKGEKVADIATSDHSIYRNTTETNIPGYKNLYITGVNRESLPLSDPDDKTQDLYFYLTFIVNKDNYRNNIVDEDIKTGKLLGVGKENIAEINGYKTYYGQKAEAPNKGNPQTKEEYVARDPAGIPDNNSVPGNLNPNDVPKDGKIKYENFENDTDKAPNIKIIFKKDNPRTVQGTVWEDIRNKKVKSAQIGNGLRENETGINGVRVQLVELRKGKDDIDYEYIWKEVYSGNKDMIDPIVNNSGTIPQYQIDTGNANGKYKFQGFVPGNYVVRFIYGSDESSVLGSTEVNYNSGNEEANPVTNVYSENGYKIRAGDNGYFANSEKIGLNKKSYNGHDYKSTSYQVKINNGEGAYNNNSTASYEYNFEEADKGLYSDAKDIMNTKSENVINIAPDKKYLVNCSNSRTEVEAYSKEPQKNKEAEILASFGNLPEYNYNKYDFNTIKPMVDEFINKTFMIAESGKINVNFEYNRGESETSGTGHDNTGSSNYDKYVLDNLDLGLEQRPKAQLKVTKQISNIKVTLADNRVLFDASGRATNVLWIDHKAHGKDVKNTYKISDNYENNLMKIPEVRQQATNKGKIQLTMDEELMHGSTIQITYAITVANVGEVDYKENKFYYTGQVGNTNNIVKTNPMKLVDYVGTQVQEYGVADDVTATRNNLEFIADKNPDWKVISADDLKNQGYVNANLENNIKKYSERHIVITEKTSKDLIPIIMDQEMVTKLKEIFEKDPMHAIDKANETNSVSGVQLTLSKVLTQDSKDDDRIYNNMTELVEVKNGVGRRMNYSIVGNQDPTIEPYEIDADDAQEVVILPPFGQKYIYYVLGSIVAVILIAGIAMTIMILKKKK